MVQARLDRSAVPVGETVTLTISFTDVSPGGPPALPTLPNLTVQSRSASTQQTLSQGVLTSVESYSYVLAPRQAGDVTIPAMQFRVGVGVLATQPLSLRILPAGAGGAANAFSNLAFLKLVLPKREVYVGEPIQTEIQLYFQNAREINMPQIDAQGFSLGQSAKPSQTSTAVGGVGYYLVVFRQAATAVKAGDLSFGPAKCDLTLQIPLRGRGQDSFGFFGPQYQARPVTLPSDVVPVKVLPLPVGDVPAGFNGAVGRFQLSVSAGPTNVSVGDPITVRVQISGQGLIETLSLPEQPDWRDFKTYPATATVNTSDPLGLQGSKTFEQVVIPLNHEIRTLPAFRFSYFDPAARTYQTLSQAAIPLRVNPSATVVNLPPSLDKGNAAAPPVDDIIPISQRLDRSGADTRLLVERSWFVVLQGVPVAAWLCLLVARRRRESLANNPRLRRRREVALRVRDGLAELQGNAAARDSDTFFATLFRLLQEQIGERLDLPSSAITEAVVDERLRATPLSQESLASIHDLFGACNMARYAPVRSSQELSAFIPRTQAALRDLQSLEI